MIRDNSTHWNSDHFLIINADDMSKELTVEAAKIATPSNHSKRASVTRKRKDIDSLHASDAPPTKRQKNAVSTRTAAPSPPRDEAPNYPASIILEKEPGLLSDLRTLLRQLKPVLVQGESSPQVLRWGRAYGADG